jgi:hypothetical protein
MLIFSKPALLLFGIQQPTMIYQSTIDFISEIREIIGWWLRNITLGFFACLSYNKLGINVLELSFDVWGIILISLWF